MSSKICLTHLKRYKAAIIHLKQNVSRETFYFSMFVWAEPRSVHYCSAPALSRCGLLQALTKVDLFQYLKRNV